VEVTSTLVCFAHTPMLHSTLPGLPVLRRRRRSLSAVVHHRRRPGSPPLSPPGARRRPGAFPVAIGAPQPQVSSAPPLAALRCQSSPPTRAQRQGHRIPNGRPRSVCGPVNRCIPVNPPPPAPTGDPNRWIVIQRIGSVPRLDDAFLQRKPSVSLDLQPGPSTV
jgi:hypothetical protein